MGVKKVGNKYDKLNYFFKNSELDKDNTSYLTHKRTDLMYKLYDTLSEHINEELVRSRGNYGSPLVLVLKNKDQDILIDFYNKILSNRGFEINHVYITYYEKCSNTRFNNIALMKELKLFTKSSRFIMHNVGIPKELEPLCDSVDFNIIKKLYDNKVSAEEKLEVKKYFIERTQKSMNYFFTNFILV